jgi:subtilase family serine protease
MGGARGSCLRWGLALLVANGLACSTDDPVPPPIPPPLASDALTTLFALTRKATLDAFALEAPLTHTELLDRYGASDETIAKLNAFGVLNGFGVNVDSTRTIAMATIRPEVAEAIFDVKLVYGTVASTNATTIGSASPVEIPFPLEGYVETIVVAAQTSMATLAYREGVRSTLPSYPEIDTSEEELCKIGLDPHKGHSADAYRTAFGLDDVDVTGDGRHVALVQLSETFEASDTDVFGRCQKIDPMPSIPVVSANVTGQRFGVDSLPALGEAQMDIQAVLTVAPGLDSIPVSIASSIEDAAGGPIPEFPVALAKALDPSSTGGELPDAVSVSYGDCEPVLQKVYPGLIELSETLMAKAFALGVVVVVSAGDSGSSDCLPNQSGTGTQAASYPGSSPYALTMGGTNLPTNDDGTVDVAKLVVWNEWGTTYEPGCDGSEPTPCRPRAGVAGGGGPSGKGLEGWSGLDAPPWQIAAGVDADGKRMTPDISMPAAPADGLVMYCAAVASGIAGSCQERENAPPNKAWTAGGGTSLSAPMMAAAVALVNQSAVAAGNEPPFPFAQWLYDLALEDQDEFFYDIVTGDNIVGDQTAKFPVDCCTAETGFDGASGWGMPRLPALIDRAAE